MTDVIALDPGFGNTKVCLDGRTIIVQSAVTRPRSMGLAAVGMKSAQRVDKVTLEQQTFAIGAGAWNHGSLLGGMDYTGLGSLERRALFFGALSQLLEPEASITGTLMVGLPVPLLQDQTQAEAVFARMKTFKGQHKFQVNQHAYQIQIDRIKILAQPVGAYANWLLDENLRVRKNGNQSEVAVLDIGMNTLDLFVLQGGQVTPRFVGGGKVGVRRLLDMIRSDGFELQELDNALRRGELRASKEKLEVWMDEILASVEPIWPNLRRFSAIIPTGGGALLLGELLRLALISKGAAVHWPDDPITANVLGLWKWGSYVSAH